MAIPLTVLAILDGFGYSNQKEGNAIFKAKTPVLDYLWSRYPRFLLKAAEEEVGLAFGEVGNSEVGHITIGTGRVIPQNLSLINKAIEDETFYSNPAFLKSIEHARINKGSVHIVGIISTAGVHGHLRHMLSLINLMARYPDVPFNLHLITDGRDAGPKDSPLYLRELESYLQKVPSGSIASMIGRAFIMDRNNNWERTKIAYEMLTGKAQYHLPKASDALTYFYNEHALDDENIPPTLIMSQGGIPKAIKPGDSLIFTNFREDRARQITKVLTERDFTEFPRENYPENFQVTTMTSYESGLQVDVAFPLPPIENTFSDVLSQHGISQIHIAETEKYAHVTYFFNGGREEKRPYEEYFMVPSFKPEEFEQHPEMGAYGITQAVLQSIDLGYQCIVFNFANCDMVGHTGNYQATISAVEIVDACLGQIWDKVKSRQGNLFITADHGNSETMIDIQSQTELKEHTISPVPLIICQPQTENTQVEVQKVFTEANLAGLLSDIAPTILTQIGLPVPSAMTGTSLL